MFQPQEMNHVLITGPSRLKEKVIKELYALKVLHIIDFTKKDNIDIGSPLPVSERLSESLVNVRAIITALNIDKKQAEERLENKKSRASDQKELNIDRLNRQIKALNDQIKSIEEDISKAKILQKDIEALKVFPFTLDTYNECSSVIPYFFQAKSRSSIEEVKDIIKRSTDRFLIIETVHKDELYALVLAHPKSQDIIMQAAGQKGLLSLNLLSNPGIPKKGSPKELFRKVEQDIVLLERKKAIEKNALKKISEEYADILVQTESLLAEKLEKAELPLKFAETKHAFLVTGWIPKKDCKKAETRLKDITKGKIYLEFESPKKGEDVPVKLDNPKGTKSFEFFMDLYALPKYKELDPTIFIFLGFPIFFGFMLGDIGYGIFTLILAFILKKMMPKAKSFFNIILLSAVSSIIFGFIFGEFFGFEKLGEFELPHLIARAEGVNELLIIAIIIGIIHVNLGLILGFINEKRSHGFKHAIFAKASWFVLQIGAALIGISIMKVLPIPIYVGLIVFLIALVMLFKGEGIRGLIEFPGIFSNILSYARLMAIGLSSVIIAMIVNDMAVEFIHKGGIYFAFAVLLLLFGHALNIALGLLGCFLHSLRLNYVEFFSKFFDGGAKRYTPFGQKE